MASQDKSAAPPANSSRIKAKDAVTAEQRATGDLLAPVDYLGFGSNGQQMAKTLSPNSPRGTRPRDNFPLPRELRDQ